MRRFLLSVFILVISGCSDSSTETKAKVPEKPPEPITGRQAFQRTFPSARTWSADCQPLRIRSIYLDQVKPEEGKAAAWEVTYVSNQQGRARTFTWSAVEAEGNIHEGVRAGQTESWSASAPQQPFPPAAIKVDTTDALSTAVSSSSSYLNKPGSKPPVTYYLEATARFPDPVWRVLWGSSVASAEYAVTIDASTGKLLQK